MAFDMKECGKRIKALRKAKAWRQVDLAHEAELRAPHLISYIESGSKVTLQAETLYMLALALGTSTDYLLGLTDDPSIFVRAYSLPGRQEGKTVLAPRRTKQQRHPVAVAEAGEEAV